eukprot:scaffold256243_cov32-Prasinocladus_malaysianus.AAC.1
MPEGCLSPAVATRFVRGLGTSALLRLCLLLPDAAAPVALVTAPPVGLLTAEGLAVEVLRCTAGPAEG